MKNKLKSQFLIDLFNWNPKLIQDLRKCDHAFDSTKLNPWHLEGDVWSHTMITLSQIEAGDNPNDIIDVCSILSAICHDFGKVVTRGISEKNERVHFYAHEFASVQPATDFLYFLKEKYNWSDEFFTKIINIVIPVVSNHLLIYEMKPEVVSKFVNFNFNHAIVLSKLMSADANGGFVDPKFVEDEKYGIKWGGVSAADFVYCSVEKETTTKVDDCKIVIMAGIPGSGKDYVAGKTLKDPLILSFDKIRIDEFEKNNKNHGIFSPQDLYSTAWEWCNKKKINLETILLRQLRENLGHPGQIVISNVHRTRKSRRKIMNIIESAVRTGDYKVGCKFVVTPKETAILRDKNRKNDKTVGAMVINSFAKEVNAPTMEEGFDAIEIYPN